MTRRTINNTAIQIPLLKDVNGNIINLLDKVKSVYTDHILELRLQKVTISGLESVSGKNTSEFDRFYVLAFFDCNINNYNLNSDDNEDYNCLIDDLNIGNTEKWAIKLEELENDR